MYNILIVDNDEQTSQLMKLHLNYEDYKIEIVDNGFDALIKLNLKKYDVVILDWTLPKIKGLKICKEIKKKILKQS